MTPKQIATELAEIKKTNFKTKAAFQKFLKKSHFTQEDVNERVKLQILSKQIQQADRQRSADALGKPKSSSYYEEAKATQFTAKPTRDVRVIVNKDEAEVEKAKEALEKDNSRGELEKGREEILDDPTTKANGGLQTGLSEERCQEPVEAAIFEAPRASSIGPVKYARATSSSRS